MGKVWWKSRVLWLNAVFAAMTAFEGAFGLLKEALGVNSYIAGVALLAGANAVLRFLTTQPLASTEPKAPT